MNLHKNKDIFFDLIEYTSKKAKLDNRYIEKDYYLTLLLKELISIDNNFVFKGGTCLSKCFKVINRFSEDIDIGYDPEIEPTQGVKRHNRDKVIKAIENIELNLQNKENIIGRRLFNRYLIDYKKMDEDNFDKIILETSYISKTYPVETKTIQSIIGETLEKEGRVDYIEKYDLGKFDIKCQSLVRTFIDKIFAICDYYLIDRTERNSRHMYDLYMLYPLVKDNKEFARLYNEIKEIRKDNERCVSSIDEFSIKLLLKEIYETNFFKKDYTTVTEPYLLYNPIDYSVLNDNLLNIIKMIPIQKGVIGYGKAYYKLNINPSDYNDEFDIF